MNNDIYANGTCECKAAGKWKYIDVGDSSTWLMCIRCNRPKYWPGQWGMEPPKESKKWWEYD